MEKLGFLVLSLLAATTSRPAEKIKSIEIAVENSWAAARPAADVVVSIPELRKVAPDFVAGSLRVICAPSANSKEIIELPSQVDDLDGDGTADELAFQIDLGPDQTRVVTIQYGRPDEIYRLRKDYPERTSALFSTKFEGLGWESENIAFRIYFDPRNAIDIYGKRRRSLQLRLYATPEYPYHDESPEGRDIFRVGGAIGLGAVAAWVDGKVVKAADVKERTWRIINVGPVRAVVELEYRDWELGEKTINARSRIIMWAGEHGFYHTIEIDPQSSATIVTGIPLRGDIPLMRSGSGEKGGAAWMGTWGEQVLGPGATATEMIAGQNLGLAIVAADQKTEFAEDQVNYLLKLTPQNGQVAWYAMAAWDQENKGGVKSPTTESTGAITSKDAFLTLVKEQAGRMSKPVKVKVLAETVSN